MNCPVCNVNLQMMDKQGITIDYCPQCRGVWLDRGELEKLIEKSVAYVPQNNSQQHTPNQNYNNPNQQGYNDHKSHDNYDKDYYHKKKKESIWGEIFDF